MAEPSLIEQIIASARWAPSGDNTQPWRFEVIDADRFRVHGSDTRDWCVYDLEGHASQLAVGALLETVALAASRVGHAASFTVDAQAPDTHPIIEVALRSAPDEQPDPLGNYIERRVTQRRPFSSRPLADADRQALESALPAGYQVLWLAGSRNRWRMALLLFHNAHIRLTIREAFEVHRRIIEWDATTSEDRIPDRALGLDALTVKTMRWAMQSWERVQFMNRWLAGTWLPRVQMDLLPGLGCAAHFVLIAERPPEGIAARLDAGRAMQRFWLACAGRGLQFQPAQTPLIFSDYARRGIRFSTDERALRAAERVRGRLVGLIGEENLVNAVYAGRVGYGKEPSARSVRLPLERLLQR